MSDEQKGGALESSSGTGASQSSDSTAQSQAKTEAPSTKMVSWANHQDALTDLQKFKKLAQDREVKLNDMESQKLREANDFKSLADKYKTELDQSKAKYEQLNGYVITTQKLNAVKDAAIVSGMRPEAIKDLELIPDFKGVDLDLTAKGNFVISGAKEFVDNLKNERPHWFAKTNAPQVNGAGGGSIGAGKQLTDRDVFKAESEAKRGMISKEDLKKVYLAYDAQRANTKH